jgi:hypothetical protein
MSSHRNRVFPRTEVQPGCARALSGFALGQDPRNRWTPDMTVAQRISKHDRGPAFAGDCVVRQLDWSRDPFSLVTPHHGTARLRL